jgi:hypothetical protein
LERLNYYFIKDNTSQYINKNLGFTKAHHLVLGYDISTSEFTHLKIEAYYQHLFDVPVIGGSSFSLINQQNDWFFDEKLQNTGKGRNYGLDITFEKYLSKGYYYMATVSLFNSQYQGGDNVWRDTRYNRNFALNFLIGKEWLLGKNQDKNFRIKCTSKLSGRRPLFAYKHNSITCCPRRSFLTKQKHFRYNIPLHLQAILPQAIYLTKRKQPTNLLSKLST